MGKLQMELFTRLLMISLFYCFNHEQNLRGFEVSVVISCLTVLSVSFPKCHSSFPMKSDGLEIKLLFPYEDEESRLRIINTQALTDQTFVAKFQIISTKKKTY